MGFSSGLRSHTIPHLEMHITHTCNLHCKYCVHYCDFKYSGEVPFSEGEQWLSAWSKRLVPETFFLLGGEPLLHEDAESYLRFCAECFPESERGFLTNGLLLGKRRNLLPVFIETDTTLVISLHPLLNKQQENMIDDALNLAVRYLEKGLNLRIINETKFWRKLYRGEGAGIMPFSENEPEKSLQSCRISSTKVLHQGKIWKCPPLAYLPLIADKLETKNLWEPYLSYKPLEIDATDADITAFMKNDSTFCDMCSVEPVLIPVPDTTARNPLLNELPGDIINNYDIRKKREVL